MKVRLISGILAAVVVLLLTGCTLLFKQPELISVTDLNTVKANDSLIFLSYKATIKNPNGIKMVIKNFQSEVFYEDQFIGVAYPQEPVRLNKRDTSQWSLYTEVNLLKINRLYKQILEAEQADFRVSNRIKVAKPGILGLFPLKVKQTLNVEPQKLLDAHFEKFLNNGGIRLVGIRPKGIHRLTELRLEVKTEVNNPFPFPYVLKELKVDLKAGNERFPLSMVSSKQEFKSGIKTTIPLQMKLKGQEMLPAFIEALSKRSRKVELIGTCEVLFFDQLFEIPIQRELTLSFGNPGFIWNHFE